MDAIYLEKNNLCDVEVLGFIRKFILVTMLVVCMAVPAFAGQVENDSIDKIEAYLTEIGGLDELPSSMDSYISEKMNNEYTIAVSYVENGESKVAYVHNKNIANLERKIDQIQESRNTNVKLQEIADGLAIGADTDTATKALSGFSGLISTLLGAAVVLITLFMTVFTGFDISYIVFPVIREMMEGSKNSGGVMAKKNSDGSTSMRFVTDEAMYAVQQATTNPGTNALLIYFQKRVASYIVLAIVLFIFLTGNITLITDIALNVVGGLLEILVGLG